HFWSSIIVLCFLKQPHYLCPEQPVFVVRSCLWVFFCIPNDSFGSYGCNLSWST
ncbi:unnamed protein product, partial [Staurois parvus]